MQACSPVSQEEIQAANKAGFLLAQVEKRTATVLCTVNNNLSIVESPDGSFYALSRGLPVRK